MNGYFRSDLQSKHPSVVKIEHKRRMMCLNENCLDPHQAIKESFLQRLESVSLNRYHSPVTAELRAKLAEYAQVEPQNLIWANGADDILFHSFLAARENENSFALSLAPSYFDFETFCDMVGMGIRFQHLNSDFSFDADEYLEKASHPDCKVAVLCNPNNPTGNLFPHSQLRHIVENLPNKLVLIDETYFEFSQASFASELHKHPNLLLVRSFSKAFSGSGLRFGYALSSAENIHELSKVFITFHSSLLSQAFALSILENKELFLDQVQRIIRERDKIFEGLNELPKLKVQPSHTNFLAFSAGEKTPELYQHLLDNEIAVRDVSGLPKLKDHLRATVSCTDDNDAFLEAVGAWAQR